LSKDPKKSSSIRAVVFMFAMLFPVIVAINIVRLQATAITLVLEECPVVIREHILFWF
jgi:hypothetical protein